MTEQEISDNKILVAEFMGYQILKKKYQYLNYNSSNESYWEQKEGDIVCDKNGNEVNFYNNEPLYSLEDIPFDTWNVLMDVVEKINTLNPNGDGSEQFEVTIQHNFCEINRLWCGNIQGRWKVGLYNKFNTIESVWFCVVDFIKWYNKNKDESK